MSDWVITDQLTVGTYTQFFDQSQPLDPQIGDTWQPLNNQTNEREYWYWSGQHWLSKLYQIKQEIPTLTGNSSLFVDWFESSIFLESWTYYSLLKSTKGTLKVRIGNVYEKTVNVSPGLSLLSEYIIIASNTEMPLTIKLTGKGQGLFKFNCRRVREDGSPAFLNRE